MDMTELVVTVPSLACLGIVVLCFAAVLMAPARFVRPSLIVMLVTVVGYMAILAITVVGSPDLTVGGSDAGDTGGESETSEGQAAPPPTSVPPSDGY
jgi:hypothetical protein